MNNLYFKIGKSSLGLPFLPELQSKDLVLNNYFYFTYKNLFHNEQIYTEEEVSLILELTDTEYFELLSKYVGKQPANLDVQKRQLTEQINALEAKLQKSTDFLKLEQEKKNYEEQYKDFEKKLSVLSEIYSKYEENVRESAQYSVFSRYNIQQIHEDLVKIAAKITELDAKLLELASQNLNLNPHEPTYYHSYDKGKIVLGAGVFLFACVIAGILNTINMPIELVGIFIALGFVAGGILIATSKSKEEIEETPHYREEVTSPEEVKGQLERLKKEKNDILRLMQVANTDEFFSNKAKFAATEKTKSYLKNVLDTALEGQDYEVLKNQQNELFRKVQELNQQLKELEAFRLNREEELALYRELDQLKLSQTRYLSTGNVEIEQIPNKLSQIRQELMAKMNGFTQVVKENTLKNLSTINSQIQQFTLNTQLTGFSLSNDLEGFENFSLVNKLISYYYIFKQIYQEDFAFIIDQSLCNLEDKKMIQFITSNLTENNIKFVILEQ